jgi:hypothetical protein
MSLFLNYIYYWIQKAGLLSYVKLFMHWQTQDMCGADKQHKWQYTFIPLKPIKKFDCKIVKYVLFINLICLGFLSSWNAYKAKKRWML